MWCPARRPARAARSRPTCTPPDSETVHDGDQTLPAGADARMPTVHGLPVGFVPPETGRRPRTTAKSRNGASSRAARSMARPFATAPRSSTNGRRSVMVRRGLVQQDVTVARGRHRLVQRHGGVRPRGPHAPSRTAHAPSGAVLAIEAAAHHRRAHGRVERAAAGLRDVQGKAHGLEEQIAHHDRHADLRRQAHQLALFFESRAAGFHVMEPAERALDGVAGALCVDVDGDHRAHHRVGPCRHGRAHCAFRSASVTAAEKASVLSVAPDT